MDPFNQWPLLRARCWSTKYVFRAELDSVTVLKSGSCNLCKYVLHVKEKGVFKDRRGIDVWIRKHTQIFVTHPGALQCDGFNSAPCHPNVAMLVGPLPQCPFMSLWLLALPPLEAASVEIHIGCWEFQGDDKNTVLETCFQVAFPWRPVPCLCLVPTNPLPCSLFSF